MKGKALQAITKGNVNSLKETLATGFDLNQALTSQGDNALSLFLQGKTHSDTNELVLLNVSFVAVTIVREKRHPIEYLIANLDLDKLRLLLKYFPKAFLNIQLERKGEYYSFFELALEKVIEVRASLFVKRTFDISADHPPRFNRKISEADFVKIINIVRMLIQAGCYPRMRNQVEAEFFVGFVKDDFEQVKALLAKIKVDTKLNNGMNALHLAALLKPSEEIIRVLSDYFRLLIDHKDRYGALPLFYAILSDGRSTQISTEGFRQQLAQAIATPLQLNTPVPTFFAGKSYYPDIIPYFLGAPKHVDLALSAIDHLVGIFKTPDEVKKSLDYVCANFRGATQATIFIKLLVLGIVHYKVQVPQFDCYLFELDIPKISILHYAVHKRFLAVCQLLLRRETTDLNIKSSYILDWDEDDCVLQTRESLEEVEPLQLAFILKSENCYQALLSADKGNLNRTFTYTYFPYEHIAEGLESSDLFDTFVDGCHAERVPLGDKTHFIKSTFILKGITLPHFFAIKGADCQVFRELKKHGCRLLGFDANRLTALDYAACFNHEETVRYYFKYIKQTVINRRDKKRRQRFERLDAATLKRFLCYAATYDDVALAKKLLIHGVPITETIYEQAFGEVLELFDYKPGRYEKTLYERYQSGKIPSKSEIENLILDYQDSSDDSSSDEETIKTNWLNQYDPATKVDTSQRYAHERFVDKFNQMSSSQREGNHEKIRCVLHRGVHYSPLYFNKQRRRQDYLKHLKRPRYKELTLSLATEKLVAAEEQQTGKKIVDTQTMLQSQSHAQIKQFTDTLKKTPNRKPKGTDDKRETEYSRMLQEYVHSYTALISNSGLQTDFGCPFAGNPFISTSFLSARAGTYASGMLFPPANRLNPHYRRSTRKPKHPVLGVIFSYAVPYPFLLQHTSNVLDLNHRGKIGIKGHYQKECEVIVESFIPEQYMLGATLMILPSFAAGAEETPSYLQYARPKSSSFTLHKKAIVELREPIDSEINIYGKNSKLNNIIRNLIATLFPIIDTQTHLFLYNNNLYPCYPFKEGTLTVSPVKPPRSGTWGEEDSPTFFSPEKKLALRLQYQQEHPESPYSSPARDEGCSLISSDESVAFQEDDNSCDSSDDELLENVTEQFSRVWSPKNGPSTF